MRRMSALAVLLLGLATASAGEVTLGEHTFTLPDGFQIELVAGPPLVDRPITADFDEQGRLYVSDSSGSNEKLTVQLEQKPHRILRLEDTDGDGKFDKQVVFADKMMFPEGTLWYDGSLYVSAPPSIWKLTDTSGDGVADKRVEWFQGKTLTGCGNDLHGPYLGPDGWIYWCKGAFAEQTYERPGKKPFVTKASHIFRSRPDGSKIEPVMTGGMDNPVDVAFTPTGDRIFTTTFLQHPGDGKRDGLIHAVYGGVYGKDWNILDGHPRTGDLMPPLAHLGAAAPCGLTSYDSAVFGPEYQHNLFACLFNMHKVTRHVLTPDGGTYSSADTDFVVSNNIDFHPTDILEDADGSLVIVNTGGWYKLCCPTSQLWKPDVLGGVYRVRKTGAPRVADPRGQKIEFRKVSTEALCEMLADPRVAVQKRAIHELGRRGPDVVTALTNTVLDAVPPVAKRNALWAATRIEHPAARKLMRVALSNPDATVCRVALHCVSLWRDSEALSALPALLNRPEDVRRAAAEALGRIGTADSAQALIAALRVSRSEYQTFRGEFGDGVVRAAVASANAERVTNHSILYALMELENVSALRTLVLTQGSTPNAHLGLIALDQMPEGHLKAAEVLPFLSGGPGSYRSALPKREPTLRETQAQARRDAAMWVLARHPEWGDELAGYLSQRITTTPPGDFINPDVRAEMARLLARFAGSAAIQKLIGETAANPEMPAPKRAVALDAMLSSGLKELPADWTAALLTVLSEGKVESRTIAVAVIRAIPPAKDRIPDVSNVLLSLARTWHLPGDVRLAALAAVPGGLPSVEPEIFRILKLSLPGDQDLSLRGPAADVLSRSKLTPGQLGELSETFATVGPLEIDKVLTAYKDLTDEVVGTKLLAALKDCPAVTAVRVDTLKAALAKLPQAIQEKSREVYAAMNIDPEQQKAKLESLLGSLKNGDVRRGLAVFHSQKANCAACHAMGYIGGRVGPDLSKVGGIRTERDLLESIVFPNSSFVRSYEPVVVTTTTGKSYNGVLKSEGAEIVLATGPKEEVRIPREEIDEMRPGNVSVMPSGLDQQLTPQDLADLIAFLKSAK